MLFVGGTGFLDVFAVSFIKRGRVLCPRTCLVSEGFVYQARQRVVIEVVLGI